MTLTVIGTGGMVPTKQTNPSGFLLEASGKKILLDCGHGIVRRLMDKGIDLNTIDAIFVSHFHTDHFADVLPLIHTRFVADLRSLQPHRPLLLIGPDGLKKRFWTARKIFWPEPKEFYPITFKEGVKNFKIGEIKITTFPVKHVAWFKSVGLKITCRDKSILYTGDISSHHDANDLIAKSRKANLLIIEGSRHVGGATHFGIEQIEKIASQSRPKKILIVHTVPKERPIIKKQIKNSNLILAELNMQMTI